MNNQGTADSRDNEEDAEDTTRQGYERRMKEQLSRWHTGIEALQAEAEKAGAEMNEELLAELAEFRELEVAGRQQLATVATTSSALWEDVKIDVSDEWNQVSGALETLWVKVQQDAKDAARTKTL